MKSLVWTMAASAAGECYTPAAAQKLQGWIDARVPGTVAGALSQAGRFAPEAPTPLHDQDFWYFCEISGEGEHRLRCGGLATFAQIYLDEALVLTSTNMFHAHDITLNLSGTHRLSIVFRSLTTAFAQTKPRARWRTQMIPNQGTRHVRTTLLGQMPGWCPDIQAVGPWREITLEKLPEIRIANVQINATLTGTAGRLNFCAQLEDAISARLHCGEYSAELTQTNAIVSGQITLENVKPWWPHSHGEPNLYPVWIEADDQKFDLGNIGFRNIRLNHGADGKDFQILVNDTPIFCRGASWINADLLNLSGTPDTYQPWLKLARDANFNMLRMSGTGAYETRAFYDLCAEMGILIWQDFMFANFDYPTSNPDFAASCAKEARDFLETTMGNPALAVLCGGSEMLQQAAMMGLPASSWSQDITGILQSECAILRPDLPFVENSPSGGSLPFITDEGVTHYYGVGAYLRPLEDARRANLRFATECLAFSQLPQPENLALDPAAPNWKAMVPRDRAASWDFEDVRQHYLTTLFGTDAEKLRLENPSLWLDASRAVTGHVMEQTFAEWRHVGSSAHGALVWTFQDLQKGLGWGVIDADAAPKPAYYALKRAFRPQQILFTDEGCNGLIIHVLNERPEPLNARIEFACIQDNGLAIIKKTRDIHLAPRSARALSANELIGAFFDTTYAYRFGPQAHYGSVARLVSEGGEVIAEAFHFPNIQPLERREVDFSAKLERVSGGWSLHIDTPAFLHFIHVSCPGFKAEDDWFHLAPGFPRQIRLAGDVPHTAPEVVLSALNSTNTLTVSA